MSKTVDELAWIYLSAFAEEGGHDIYAISKPDQRTIAGIAAVIRALRDVFREEYGMWERFTEILGSDAGNEKAAGGPRPEAMGSAPLATAPAPAVCEWTKRGRNEPGFYNTPHGLCHINHLPKSGGCWCGNPIKFTEALTKGGMIAAAGDGT